MPDKKQPLTWPQLFHSITFEKFRLASGPYESIFPRFILSNFALIIQLNMLTHFKNSLFVADLS